MDKSNWSLIFERPNCRERGEEEKREEEEEEEEEKSRKMEEPKRYGTMNSCMNFHTIAWLVSCPKPRVC